MSFVTHIFNRKYPEEIELEDVQRLIDNKILESTFLEYKAIAKDVSFQKIAEVISGFLNSSGGIIVFGLSEKDRIPKEFTWSNLNKERVENSLFSLVQPWDESIRIIPIRNPDDENLRIFIIYVPQSKNPPHMANNSYFTRLNFQIKQLGHEQVSRFFRQKYLMKSNLINSVYGPIYNELVTYLHQFTIKKWVTANLEQILRENRFLIDQDEDFVDHIDFFFSKVTKWNRSLDVVPFKLTRIINSVASDFFGKDVYDRKTESAVRLNIKSVSSSSTPAIDNAILNNKHPIDFWKEENEFSEILEIRFELQVVEPNLNYHVDQIVAAPEFERFLLQLKTEVDKNGLIRYIRQEFTELQSLIENYFLEALDDRMQ